MIEYRMTYEEIRCKLCNGRGFLSPTVVGKDPKTNSITVNVTRCTRCNGAKNVSGWKPDAGLERYDV